MQFVMPSMNEIFKVEKPTNESITVRTFRVWDDNGDRKLDVEELSKGVREFGAVLDDQQLRQLFQSPDKDGSGYIDVDELIIALRVITGIYFIQYLL